MSGPDIAPATASFDEHSVAPAPLRDRLLRPAALAEILAISPRTLRRTARLYPFTVQLPTGALRFSERRLAAWLERTGKVASTFAAGNTGSATTRTSKAAPKRSESPVSYTHLTLPTKRIV